MVRISGTENSERLEGGAGSDVLIGLEGNDILVGGGGNDVFVLGYQTDIFYQGNDFATIEDFRTGDKILVGGNLSQYRLDYQISTQPYGINTTIYYGNDLIAYVKGGAGLTYEDFLVSGGSANTVRSIGIPDSLAASHLASTYSP